MPRRHALIAAAVAALAGLIWLVTSSIGSKPDTVAALPTPVLEVKPTHAPAALPEPAKPPPPTVAAAAPPATSSHPSGLVESARSALAGAEEAVSVTVHVSPANAAVFLRGRHFGTGEVTVKVVRGTKTRLFAQLEGYLPRTVVVDGTSKSVHIELKRLQSVSVRVPRPAAAREEAASSIESKSDPSQGASKSTDAVVADTPSNSASFPDSEPTKRSPSPSAGTTGSEPISDVDPL